jgi:phosphatidylserine/phosphatidylglycerophosphate/cardiolipin synthase-like enzyme
MSTAHRVTKISAAHPLANLAVLDQFKQQPFPPGYPPDVRTFYSPIDDLKGALLFLINNAQHEIDVGMYGFDDPDLATALKTKLADPSVRVRLTLDSSQAGGTHERQLLATEAFPNSSIAIGNSEHGRIMHMKILAIDGTILATGSTNWSDAAEHLQDNELTVTINAARAAEARIRLDTIHAHMLTKQVK